MASDNHHNGDNSLSDNRYTAKLIRARLDAVTVTDETDGDVTEWRDGKGFVFDKAEIRNPETLYRRVLTLENDVPGCSFLLVAVSETPEPPVRSLAAALMSKVKRPATHQPHASQSLPSVRMVTIASDYQVTIRTVRRWVKSGRLIKVKSGWVSGDSYERYRRGRLVCD